MTHGAGENNPLGSERITPDFDAAFVAPGARIMGAVSLGKRASVWYSTLVDGTSGEVLIEDEANLQDNVIVRGVAGYVTRIGVGTSVGHNATVVGATIAENCLVAMGAIVHPGASIGAGAIVAAKAVVPAEMRIPERCLVLGNGRIAREVSEAERQRILRGRAEYVRLSREHHRTLRALGVIL